MNKSKVQRVQILLEPKQQEYLTRVSKKSGQSVSSLIRDLVAEKMEATRDRRLGRAARELAPLYKTDEELNAFHALDGEDWNE